MNLFNNIKEPLAAQLRPESLDGVVGQEKIIKNLQRMKEPVSIIFYGPPGTGKTTIAMILGKKWNLPFRSLSGVSSGVKEVRELIEETEKIGTILIFLDEIHRFSSSQQDSLLHAIEDGHVILIGATTENPAFRINRPLLSRCNVLKLELLDENALEEILAKSLAATDLAIEKNAKITILNAVAGDGRKLIGIIEGLSSLARENKSITQEFIDEYMSSRVIQYDKNKEYLDVISAFIKSIRGSDPDAALFYLAVMLEGGEDPLFIMRRLVILASEDIGNASVHALNLAVSGMSAIEKIGLPEGRIIISQVTTFLASCPKSNSSYVALAKASEFVKAQDEIIVPNHLRNPVSSIHKKEGAGEGYVYPHDMPQNFIHTNYFPENLKGENPQFYFPTVNGMEKKIKETLDSLWRGQKNYK